MPKKLIHYSTEQDLDFIDPKYFGSKSGKRISPEYRGGTKFMVPRSYYYTEDRPEPAVERDRHKHIAYLPDDFRIYDLSADPEGIIPHVQQVTGHKGPELYDAIDHELKNRGYHGYHNPTSTLPHAMAVFYPIKAHKTAQHPFFGQQPETIKKFDQPPVVCPLLGGFLSDYQSNLHHYKHMGPQDPQKYVKDWNDTHHLAIELELPEIERLYDDTSTIEAAIHLADKVAHTQKDLMTRKGYEISDSNFAKEYNSLVASVAMTVSGTGDSCLSHIGFCPSEEISDLKDVLLFYSSRPKA